MLSEINQRQDSYYMVSLTCGIKTKTKTKKWTSEKQRVGKWLPGDWGVGKKGKTGKMIQIFSLEMSKFWRRHWKGMVTTADNTRLYDWNLKSRTEMVIFIHTHTKTVNMCTDGWVCWGQSLYNAYIYQSITKSYNSTNLYLWIILW